MPPEFIDAMRHFLKAAYRLNREADRLSDDEMERFADDYPFSESFDEVVHQIDAWVNTVEGKPIW